ALVARWLPLGDDVRFCVAYYVPLPLWVVLACGVARARSGGAAWAACGGLALALQLVIWLS
ncbi:MAG: hypothetical protein H7138_25470, partial [Myxococcales bacterium]|nr:hypothetical protein [Myxococcales bacterium]